MAATSTQQGNSKLASTDAPAKAGSRGTPAPGSRLAEAFEAVERFPVLIESRERVIAAATAETARIGELVEAVESDVALTISVLRFANRSGVVAGGVGGHPRGGRRAQALRRAGDRRHRSELRLLRVQRRLGAEARALPRPRPRHPARRRPDRPRGRLGRTRRARGRRAPARRRPARDLPPAPRLQGLLRRDLPHPRAAPARRTRAARHRPLAGRRRARPALEPAAADRGRDRAPPRRRRRRPRRDGRHRRHGRPLLPGRGDLAGPAARQRRALRARPRRPARPALRAAAAAPGIARGSASPARSRRASSTSSATSPRAWSTSRSPARCSSRSRRSAPTCTTSTARSAPSTAPRPCSPPATAAGSSRALSRSGDSRRAIATAWVRFWRRGGPRAFFMWVLTVSSLRSSFARRDRRRLAVGEQLQDLALAAGQLAAAAFRRHRRVDEALLGGGGVDRAAQRRRCRRCGRRRRWRRPAGRRWRGGARAARRGRRCRAPAEVLRRARIASWPLIEAPAPFWRQRMSTIATSKSPMSRTRSRASSRLLDSCTSKLSGEHLADPEPDQRVIVDHKAVWAFAQDCFRSLVAALGAGCSLAPHRLRS